MSTNTTITPRKRTRSSARLGGAETPFYAASPATFAKVAGPSILSPNAKKTKGAEHPSFSPAVETQPLLTPPASSHKHHASLAASPVIGPRFSPSKVAAARKPNRGKLPAHLDTLLKLHNALELTLALQIATQPPILPPMDDEFDSDLEFGNPLQRHLSSPSSRGHKRTASGSSIRPSITTRKVALENVTNYVAIKPLVEKTCQRRFGVTDLKRLVTLWSWDGRSCINEPSAANTAAAAAAADDDNPFLESSSKPAATTRPWPLVTRQGYVLSSTRTIDPTTQRRIHTYGIGIQVVVDPHAGNRAQDVRHKDADHDSLESLNRSAAAGAVGRWSAGGNQRSSELEDKLWKWVELTGGLDGPSMEDAAARQSSGLPTPSTSGDSSTERDGGIPHVPMADFPPLPSASNGLLAKSASAVSTPSASSSTPMMGRVLHLPPPAPARPRAAASGSAFARPALEPMAKLEPPVSLAGPAEIKTSSADEADVFGPVIAVPKPNDRRQALFERIKAREQAKASGGNANAGQGGSSSMSNLSTADLRIELKRRSTLSRLEAVAEAIWMFFSITSTGAPSSPGSSPRARRRAHPLPEVLDVIVKSSKTPISAAEARDSVDMLTNLCPWFLICRVFSKQEWLEMPASAHFVAPVEPSTDDIPAAFPASPKKPVSRQGALRNVRERIRQALAEQ